VQSGNGPGNSLDLSHTAHLTFDLPAGIYRLWCSLPEHEEKGMATSLIVQ